MLKTVENLGVSHLKGSEQYTQKLDKEFQNLHFPYKTDVSNVSYVSIVPQLTPNHFDSLFSGIGAALI